MPAKGQQPQMLKVKASKQEYAQTGDFVHLGGSIIETVSFTVEVGRRRG